MGSAIGNYIHYNASRYLKYGVTKNTPGKNVDARYWLKIRHDMMSRAKQIRTDKELEELEKQYNAFRQMITLSDTKEMERVRQTLADMILEGVENKEDYYVDWGTGNIYELNPNSIQGLGANLRKITSSKQIQERTQLSYAETVLSRFKSAFDKLKEIQNVSSKAALEQALKNLQASFLGVAEASDKTIREALAANSKLGVGIHKTKGYIITREQAQEAVKQIRILMGRTQLGSLGYLKGRFEEYVAAAAKLKAMGVALDNIEDFENQLRAEIGNYGGSNKTKTTISSDIMSLSRQVADEMAKNKDYSLKDKSGTYRFKLSESEQKMDALFTWQGGPAEGIPLSIKNYNLSSQHPISLVTKSPLAYFLFNMGNVDYTNHFLNIFAAHKTTPSPLKTMRTIAEESLAYYLLWSAMSGRGSGKTEGFADVFVVNDNSRKNSVKIFDIGKLVNNVINRSDAMNNIQIDPLLSTISLHNTFEKQGKNIGDNIQRRLTKLIAHSRAIKMTVHLNTGVFKDN